MTKEDLALTHIDISEEKMGSLLFPQAAQHHEQEDGPASIGGQRTEESIDLFPAEDLKEESGGA